MIRVRGEELKDTQGNGGELAYMDWSTNGGAVVI